MCTPTANAEEQVKQLRQILGVGAPNGRPILEHAGTADSLNLMLKYLNTPAPEFSDNELRHAMKVRPQVTIDSEDPILD